MRMRALEVKEDVSATHTDEHGNRFVVQADYDRLKFLATRALRDIAAADRFNEGGPRVRLLKQRAVDALREIG